MKQINDQLQRLFAILLFPLVFIITLPIELPVWKEYKKQGYSVPNYITFFWYRCMLLKEQNYKKN